MAVMWANLKSMGSQMVDYLALHLQMETQRGWKMVDQIYSDSLMAGMWANLILTDSQRADYLALYLQMETQKGWKMVGKRY